MTSVCTGGARYSGHWQQRKIMSIKPILSHMNKKTVYLETSFISYLTSRPSRDILVSTHQILTQQWWASRRDDFTLYISELVILEAQRGDAEAAKRRMVILNGLDSLNMSPAVEDYCIVTEPARCSGKSKRRCSSYCRSLCKWYRLFINVELRAHCKCRMF